MTRHPLRGPTGHRTTEEATAAALVARDLDALAAGNARKRSRGRRARTLRVAIRMTLTVDVTAWDAEYGTAESLADIRASVQALAADAVTYATGLRYVLVDSAVDIGQ